MIPAAAADEVHLISIILPQHHSAILFALIRMIRGWVLL
jgi:hypothetical protein